MTNEIKWSVNQSNSEIIFKVRHLMIAQITGSFKIFDAAIYTTGKDFTNAQIDLRIDTSSIHTGDKKRDEHLKSINFFDVEHHKQITFTSDTMQNPYKPGNRQ